jgi:AAA+ ATPase superfamily predicted ATPase
MEGLEQIAQQATIIGGTLAFIATGTHLFKQYYLRPKTEKAINLYEQEFPKWFNYKWENLSLSKLKERKEVLDQLTYGLPSTNKSQIKDSRGRKSHQAKLQIQKRINGLAGMRKAFYKAADEWYEKEVKKASTLMGTGMKTDQARNYLNRLSEKHAEFVYERTRPKK